MELRTTSFLFVDTQIADESFLEDINNILSSGEVPNLYKTDEFEEVEFPQHQAGSLAFLTSHRNPTGSTSVSIASPPTTTQISPCEAKGLVRIRGLSGQADFSPMPVCQCANPAALWPTLL